MIRDPDTASQTLLDCFALHRANAAIGTVLAPAIFSVSSDYTSWRSMYQRIVATAMNIYLPNWITLYQDRGLYAS